MLRKIIERSPPTSCPSDPIPTRLLKICLIALLPAITTLIRSSLRIGVFPTAFKEGRILPKIKKITLDKEDFSNYRTVTNLPFLSKVLERAAPIQVRDYLSTNQLYPRFQSAYREFQSTQTALPRVHNDILRTIDQKKEAILVLLDLSAFDTIYHDILINRLNNKYGFTGTVLRWFESYTYESAPRKRYLEKPSPILSL